MNRWRMVAAGNLDDAALRAWLASVAEGVLQAAGEKDANKRRQAVLDATGISGRLRADTYLADLMLWAADEGVPAPEDKPKARRMMVALGANLPVGTPQELDPEALRKRIERARKRR
jgi:hypothetical protein